MSHQHRVLLGKELLYTGFANFRFHVTQRLRHRHSREMFAHKFSIGSQDSRGISHRRHKQDFANIDTGTNWSGEKWWAVCDLNARPIG